VGLIGCTGTSGQYLKNAVVVPKRWLPDELGSESEHWRPPWGPTTPLQLPLPLTGGLVPVHPISPTLLRSRGQSKFKYSYLLPPSEAPFKDKTMTKLKCSKADNTSGMRRLFLNDGCQTNLGRNRNIGAHRDNSPSTSLVLDWGACSGTPNKSHIA